MGRIVIMDIATGQYIDKCDCFQYVFFLNTYEAGLRYIGNYHAVTAGPVPPLVMLTHARGRLDY